MVLAVACTLPACSSKATYSAKAPVKVGTAPVTIRVKKVRVHRDPTNQRYLLDVLIDLTAERTIELGPFSLTSPMDTVNRADIQGEVVLFAGETKRFVVKDSILADEHELPAFQVVVIEGGQAWRLHVPLWDSERDPVPPPFDEPAPRPSGRTFGVITADVLGVIPERNGFDNVVIVGVGASSDFGPVRVRFDVDGAASACDPGTCPKEGERRKWAWGAGLKPGIEMLPFRLSSAPAWDQFSFGVELCYPLYLLNQPRAGGNEGIWLHGPLIVPKIEWTEGGPGKGRSLGIGLPMGLFWTSGADARPGFAVGGSMLADF